MKLIDYLLINDGLILAEKIGTSRMYLSHLAHGRRKASPKLARSIEEATNGEVSISELRPDLAELFGDKGRLMTMWGNVPDGDGNSRKLSFRE